MGRLDSSKLHVTYLQDVDAGKFSLPRRYTLTHSDLTGELFLSIGVEYDKRRISRLYTRLMRDEVLAEFTRLPDGLEFAVFCHVSGGPVVGGARWRYAIFQSELSLALEAMRYGDRSLFENKPRLDLTPVVVHFESTKKKFNRIESWGVISDYSG